jgi:3-amino-4-hydroxybenzoic acid synthase
MSLQPLELDSSIKKPIRLERLSSDKGGQKATTTQIWYDTRAGQDARLLESLLLRLSNFSYTGVLLDKDRLSLVDRIPVQMKIGVFLNDESEVASLKEIKRDDQLIVVSGDRSALTRAAKEGLPTCLYQYVDDGESLHAAIRLGSNYNYLMIAFKDPTNIPLELVIASLQATGTTLIKEITRPDDVEDAVVSLGVMEVGADGVMFSPPNHDLLERFSRQLESSRKEHLALEPAVLLRSEPIGMGYRSCIDVATLFSDREGMLVGSTSQGGVLCCPEVFYLPYMQTRPFRINAGGVHSYVYNAQNRTNYMTELSAGSSVLIVGLNGETRKSAVGRMKTELRPLRLIEARFATGEVINVIMQDDWHVRVFSPEGQPLNVTELRPGDKVMAYKATPGRHVGIKIDENIVET